MALTATAVKNAKPREKTYKLYDERGLYLEVTPKGAKRWRLKYRRPITRVETRISLGVYPDIGLKDARERRDEARKLLANKIDPGEQRKKEKQEALALATNTFEKVAQEWCDRHLAGKSKKYQAKVIRILERDTFPLIGRRPVAELKASEVLNVLRRLESRNIIETAHKARTIIGQVMRYAIATNRAERDPTEALKGALKPIKRTHMAAPTDPKDVAALLRMMDAHKGTVSVGAALKLLPLLFVRPGELRAMRWEEVDLSDGVWCFTSTKKGKEHIVPLSRQAVAILHDLHPFTGHLPGGWVFPGSRTPLKHISDAAINAAYRRLGIGKDELTAHGWRATARTLLHERLGYDPVVIEHQLSHAVPGDLGDTYARTKFLDERRSMMQAWADLLDHLRNDNNVVPLHRKEQA